MCVRARVYGCVFGMHVVTHEAHRLYYDIEAVGRNSRQTASFLCTRFLCSITLQLHSQNVVSSSGTHERGTPVLWDPSSMGPQQGDTRKGSRPCYLSLEYPKGAPGTRAPLSVEILSFLCSFQQKSCQIIIFFPNSGIVPPVWESWIRHCLFRKLHKSNA